MKKSLCIIFLIIALLLSAFFGYSLNSSEDRLLWKEHYNETVKVNTYSHKRHLYFEPQEKYVKPLGRTVYYDNCLWFSMSGSGGEFIINANSVDITLICDDATSLNYNHRPRVAIFVNGNLQFDDVLNEKETTVTIELPTENEENTVTVVKLSESMYSSCGISKIYTYSDKDIRASKAKQKKIEFIGDSITAGFGIDEENPKGSFSTATENFTKTYAYLTSQKLNYDYSAVAFSGYGVLYGYGSSKVKGTENVLSKYYEEAITNKSFDSSYPYNKWDFSNNGSDIVVINLGVNDAVFCSSYQRKEEFKKAYKKLIGLVRWHNKNADILCILGEVNNSLFPYIEQAAKEYSEENADERIYSFSIDFKMAEEGSVINGHPNAKSNEIASEELTKIIEEINAKTFSIELSNLQNESTTEK